MSDPMPDGYDRLRAELAPAEQPQSETPKEGAPVVVWLSEVEPEEVRWLWAGRIPFGKLTVLDGDPGLGKSTMMADIVARLTTGRPLPEDPTVREPATAMFIAHEDGYGDTASPRLISAGADLRRVCALDGIREADGGARLPAIPGDLIVLESLVREHDVKLVVIDPLNAYLGAGVDAYKDHEIRRGLAPLATMAERTGTAVVLIRHMGKTPGRSAMYRGLGSVGIIGIARSGLLLAKDPDDDSGRVLASIKSNLGPPPPSLAWRFAGGGQPRVEWVGESAHTADQLVNVPMEGSEERGAMDEACVLLRDLLAEGPMLAKDVLKQASAALISERTLKRARSRLGIVSRKTSFTGKWEWELPKGAIVETGPSSSAGGGRVPGNGMKPNGFSPATQEGHAQEGQGGLASFEEETL